MALFVDESHAVDLDYVVAVFPMECGRLSDETPYSIGILLHVAQTAERLSLDYASRSERDNTLARLLELLQVHRHGCPQCEGDE